MKQKGFAPIYFLIGLVILGVILWYLGDPLWKKIFNYFSYINNPTNFGTTIIVPSPIPTSTNKSTASAETANWKTFIGKSFTFNYPAELKIPDKAIETKSEGFIIPTDVKDEYLGISTGRTETVKTSVIQTVDDAKEAAINSVGYFGSSYQGKTKLGGLEALIFATDKPFQPDSPQQINLPPYKIYIIFSDSELDGKKAIREVRIEYFAHSKNAKTFDQILSTFKFTN